MHVKRLQGTTSVPIDWQAATDNTKRRAGRAGGPCC